MIKDANIISLIERIGDHYRTNVSSRFIRPALLQLPLEKQVWDLVDMLTEKMELYRNQGFHLEELYQEIGAAARFVSLARRDLVPILRKRLSGGGSGADKVLQDMAVNNFSSNLQVFAELVNELYTSLVELDKHNAKGHPPLYTTIPELKEIDHMLMGN